MANGFRPIIPGGIGEISPPITRYLWSTNTLATNPGSGRIKGNNSDLSLITEIYISDITQSGLTLSAEIDQVEKGDLITLVQSTNQSKYLSSTVTGSAVDNSGWHTIPVIVNDSTGSFSTNDLIDLIYFAAAQRSGIVKLNDGDIMKVLADQVVFAGARVSVLNVWTFDNPPIGLSNNIQMMFSKNANLANGIFLISGEVTTSTTHGPLAPVDMTLKTVTIARTDTDAADIEILCAGVVIATVATSAIAVVDDTIDFTCSQGDIFSVRNKSGSSTMSNVIVTLLFEV